MVRTPHSHCLGPGSIPGQGNYKVPQAKEKKKILVPMLETECDGGSNRKRTWPFSSHCHPWKI